LTTRAQDHRPDEDPADAGPYGTDTLLVVDDNRSLAEMLALQLEVAEGDRPAFRVEIASTVAEARAHLARIQPVLILCDMRLPDGDGIELLPEMKALGGEAPVVIMTAHGDMETTIRAMKNGAFDYLQKPFDQDEVELVVLRAIDLRRHFRRAAVLAVDTAAPHLVNDIVAESRQMKSIVKQIGKIAASKATVLIQGESGTGKELIARVIHTYSSDEPKPFVGINCSAIVDTLLESELFGHEKGSFTGAANTKFGKFELAEDGTIFLDEIAEMSLPLQAKLLRVLQEREFERVGGVRRLPLRARIVAATNRDLEREAAAGRFREDLFQRLKVVTVELPPLRERAGDIPKLTQRLLQRIGARVGKQTTRVSAELLEHLQALPWPGNVRELENALTRAVVLAPGELLLPEHFPPPEALEAPEARRAEGRKRVQTLAEVEKEAILRALDAAQGHKGRACELLGISRPTLERKLERHGLSTPRRPHAPPSIRVAEG